MRRYTNMQAEVYRPRNPQIPDAEKSVSFESNSGVSGKGNVDTTSGGVAALGMYEEDDQVTSETLNFPQEIWPRRCRTTNLQQLCVSSKMHAWLNKKSIFACGKLPGEGRPKPELKKFRESENRVVTAIPGNSMVRGPGGVKAVRVDMNFRRDT